MSRLVLPVSKGPDRWRPGCWPYILGGAMLGLAIFYALYFGGR